MEITTSNANQRFAMDKDVNYADLFDAIEKIYEWNCVGGPLHIVLDDGNTDDKSIRYCLDSCRDHWSVVEDAGNADGMIRLVEMVGSCLLQIDETERDRLYGIRWGRSIERNE